MERQAATTAEAMRRIIEMARARYLE